MARPDGFEASGASAGLRRAESRIAIEVELAVKSRSRLESILNLHLAWLISYKTDAVTYICGDEEACRRIERAGDRVGFYGNGKRLRIELLETIKAQASEAFERSRSGGTAEAA